jgi:substrate import-associated zinc metallohydrolase lipoprotein
MKKLYFSLVISILVTAFNGCYEEEKLNVPVRQTSFSIDPIDIYIQENFTDPYGIAVRYKFVDRYVDQTKRVSPPRREAVIPMLDFIADFWIDPFLGVPNGGQFFRRHVPAEVIFIGSSMFNDDGTVTLGTADAGARITLTEVNDIDPDNRNWVFRQLGTIYHEFAHIVHQRYNLPPNFQQISPGGYTSAGSWYNLTDEEALQRGFVSPYATSSFNEDFAETVAFMLFDPGFYQNYIYDEPNCTTANCTARNEGRAKIRTKFNSIVTHYKQVTGVDLLQVRAIVQQKLN